MSPPGNANGDQGDYVSIVAVAPALREAVRAAEASGADTVRAAGEIARRFHPGQGADSSWEALRLVAEQVLAPYLRRELVWTAVEAWRRWAEEGALAVTPVEGDVGGPAHTHDGLALELGATWDGTAKHVQAWGKWLFFDPATGIWDVDAKLDHLTRTRAFLRERAADLPPEHHQAKKTLRAAATVAAVVGLARSNPDQAGTVGQWDADPTLLGTPAGAIDLLDGRMRPARPADYLTRTTATCPASVRPVRWLAFLERITGGSRPLQDYLQRFAGYALTGSVQEHSFAFGYGTGANGKSVFLGTLHGIMGGYACTVPAEVLMQTSQDRHPTELARLRGVRLAVVSETEQGKRWAEAKIKSLTGGDPIAARFMHQDFFEFAPQFKLFIVGNHRPSLRGVDEAMRRRLHCIPFTVTIPPAERDPGLLDKLRGEWPAILQWAIDGCLEWNRIGLAAPDEVTAFTREYLEAEDAFALWAEECTTRDAQAWEPVGMLFASWKAWAERAQEYVGTQKSFSQLMAERGFRYEPRTKSRGYIGLRLPTLAQERAYRDRL